jgi:hypothetical protein
MVGDVYIYDNPIEIVNGADDRSVYVPFFENLVFVDGCYPCFVQEDVGAFSFVGWEVDEENGIFCCFFEVSDRLWCAMILGHKL